MKYLPRRQVLLSPFYRGGNGVICPGSYSKTQIGHLLTLILASFKPQLQSHLQGCYAHPQRLMPAALTLPPIYHIYIYVYMCMCVRVHTHMHIS